MAPSEKRDFVITHCETQEGHGQNQRGAVGEKEAEGCLQGPLHAPLPDPPVKAPEQEQRYHSGQIWMLSQSTGDTTKGKVLTGEMTLI